MSYEPVADGDLAAVVTFLEMTEPRDCPSPSRDCPSPSRDCPLTLRPLAAPALDTYRALFRLVGAPWLWFSRLIMDDAALSAIIHHPGVTLFVVTDADGADAGLVELDFRETGQCELAFIGLVPALAGQGHGRWLLGEALRRAWAGEGVTRVHVHTCSLDHPAALAAYRRAGFTPYQRAIERFPDPRLLGILPASAAPHIPLLGTPASPAAPSAAPAT